MGCVQGLPTSSDLELDWVTEYTEPTHDQVEKQNEILCQNNHKKNIMKWKFGSRNSVHQMTNTKIIDVFA